MLDTVCVDWWEKLQANELPVSDRVWSLVDEDLADQAESVFSKLEVPDAVEDLSFAIAAGQWIKDIVRIVFGACEVSAGALLTRHVAEIFILVPKKNGKSTYSAGIGLTFMLLNMRKNASAMIVGPTQEIANVAFRQAQGIIEADPEGYLAQRFHVRTDLKQIQDRLNGTILAIKTFSTKILTGGLPVFCLIDEVHELGTIAGADDVMRQIRGGMLPFGESLLVMITTQSQQPPAGVFKSELQYARDVRDGRVQNVGGLLPILYEFPEDIQRGGPDVWLDQNLWPLVQPNVGKSLTLDALVVLYERARRDGDSDVAKWATQHLNIEVGQGLHHQRWVGVDHWSDAADRTLTLDEMMKRCEVIVAGIDGGGLDDLAGLSLCGRERATGLWLFWQRAWCSEEAIERRKQNEQIYRDFAKDGDLVICPPHDPTRDHRDIAEILAKVNAAGLMPEENAVGLDPVGVAELVDALIDAGLSEDQLCAVAQGYKLSSAIWAMERRLADKTCAHDGSAMMSWVVSNAVAEMRGNAVIISKQTAGRAKIDPLIALLNAYTLMTRNPRVEKSYLEGADLMVLS